MFLIPTYVAPSPIHGLGVFTAVDLKQDQQLAIFVPDIDQQINPAHLEIMLPVIQEFVKRYGYLEDGRWKLNADHMRFMNHADCANTYAGFQGIDYARVDIPANTELTCNYRTFDDSAPDKLGAKTLSPT